MLKVYGLEQNNEWDQIVRSFMDYDIYWLSGYVRAFQIHGDGEPMLFYYEDEAVRGVNVVMKRDVAKDPHFAGKLPKGKYFDFSTPYGYGGWLIEGDGDTAPLFDAYENWCTKHRIVSEFVRFHPVLRNHEKAAGTYDVVPLGGTIAIDLSSPETIWANFTSNNRNMIRKAEKNGVKIYSGRSEEVFIGFTRIYEETMDRDNATEYYYFGPEFYQSICYDLQENAEVFYAVDDQGEMIAASIMMQANGRMNYHLSGVKTAYRNLAPTNLLLYKAALWGCANGCKTLHLGGGLGSAEDDLYKFKESFYRREPCRFNIGRKIFDMARYDDLVAIREADDQLIGNTSFFPAYRRGGYDLRTGYYISAALWFPLFTASSSVEVR